LHRQLCVCVMSGTSSARGAEEVNPGYPELDPRSVYDPLGTTIERPL
jgi:hypothetical protein